jgi:hypothetical protein
MSAPVRRVVGLLFAPALVLAFVGGEWHGRRSVDASEQSYSWAHLHVTVTGSTGAGAADICAKLKGDEDDINEQRPGPDRMSLEESYNGVDWRECDEDGCAERYRRVRVIHPDGRVVVSAFAEVP